MKTLRLIINWMLRPFNIAVVNRKTLLTDAGSFTNYLANAKREGMDVNDWIEQRLGWPAALPTLEKIVFPYLKEGDTVCEIGVGTGRWSRQILTKIPKGRLLLIDSSTWVVNFVKRYFKEDKRVSVFRNDSKSLADIPDKSVDLVFSDGTFIGLKLGYFHLYSRECYRILKSGGYLIFDYHDTSNPVVWEVFEKESETHYGFNAYHESIQVDRIFIKAGFEIIKRYTLGKSTYLVLRKKPLMADELF